MSWAARAFEPSFGINSRARFDPACWRGNVKENGSDTTSRRAAGEQIIYFGVPVLCRCPPMALVAWENMYMYV